MTNKKLKCTLKEQLGTFSSLLQMFARIICLVLFALTGFSLWNYPFYPEHFLPEFSLKFRCAIMVIIYLNSLLFPLTKEIWTKLEIKLADDEWRGSGEGQEE